MTNSQYAVRTQYATDAASQLLTRPVSALTGVTVESGQFLESLGITTIFDLAASSIFDSARQITLAAAQPSGPIADRVAGDFVDSANRTPKSVAVAPLSVLRSIDDGAAREFQDKLGLNTVQDLANWSPYHVARAILNEGYGLSPTIRDDPERPDDLIPIARRYATERVQYDIIVMDRVLTHEAIDAEDLITAGAIDVSDIVSAALITRPALGAVLTYRQSWYPQGLALGHLLHSMALAPGEST